MPCSAAEQEAICEGCHCSGTGLAISWPVVSSWDFVLFYYYFFFLFLGFVFLGFLFLLTKRSSSQPTSLTGTVLVLSPCPWGRVSVCLGGPWCSGLNLSEHSAPSLAEGFPGTWLTGAPGDKKLSDQSFWTWKMTDITSSKAAKLSAHF